MAGGSKAQKLRGALAESKIALCLWMKSSIVELPPAKKASDILDIIKAYKLLTDMAGKGRPDGEDEYKLEQPDVTKASEEIRRALKRVGDVQADIFGEKGGDDED
jgi:hypothetical protein